MSSVTLETLSEKLDLALARLAALQGQIGGASPGLPGSPAGIPKARPVSETDEMWAWILSLADDFDEPELHAPMEVFDRTGAFLRVWCGYDVRGVKVVFEPELSLRREFARSILTSTAPAALPGNGGEFVRFCANRVAPDTAFYALFTGRTEPHRWYQDFGSRPANEIAQLEGKTLEQLVAIDLSEARPGGGPGLGGA